MSDAPTYNVEQPTPPPYTATPLDPDVTQGAGRSPLRSGLPPPSSAIALSGAAPPPNQTPQNGSAPPQENPIPGAQGAPTGEYPADLDRVIIGKEGSGDSAVSPKGAIGRNQIMPQTAAGYGVTRDQLFDPETNNKVGNQIRRDLWAKYHDATAVMIAYNAGPGVADRWLASGKNPNVLPHETQKYIGAGLATGGDDTLRNWMNKPGSTVEQGIMARADMMEKSAGDFATLYDKISKDTVPGSEERARMMREAHLQRQDAEKRYLELSTNPPTFKPIDAFQQFGSIAVILAGLGGLMTRQHATAALNAAGAAMEAANTNNKDQFDRQMTIWQKQTEAALKVAELARQDIDEILNDRKIEFDDKDRKLANLATVYGIQYKGMEAGMQAMESLARVTGTAKAQAEQMQTMMAIKEIQDHPEADPAKIWAKWHAPGAYMSASMDPKKQSAEAFKSEIHAKTGNDPTYQDWVKFSQDTGSRGTGQLSPEAIKLMAHQYEMGDPGVITSLPRSGPARIQLENQVAEDLKGMDDAAGQIVMNRLRMAEARSAATTAGRVTMNTALFAQEAKGAGQEVVRTSKLFPSTEIPLVNVALRAYETNTGDPRVIKFGIAMNALVNAYGKMSNPTGTGIHDADKDRFTKILDTSLSHGQVEAGVEQVIKEGMIVSHAAQEAQSAVLKSVMPSPPGTTPAAPAAQSATGGVLPPNLPSPAGHAEGSTLEKDGRVVARLRNGQWVAP
jgi:hypothetical protein